MQEEEKDVTESTVYLSHIRHHRYRKSMLVEKCYVVSKLMSDSQVDSLTIFELFVFFVVLQQLIDLLLLFLLLLHVQIKVVIDGAAIVVRNGARFLLFALVGHRQCRFQLLEIEASLLLLFLLFAEVLEIQVSVEVDVITSIERFFHLEHCGCGSFLRITICQRRIQVECGLLLLLLLIDQRWIENLKVRGRDKRLEGQQESHDTVDA